MSKDKDLCCESTPSCCAEPLPAVNANQNNLGNHLPLHMPSSDDSVCCGPPAGPASSPLERPGYRICHFVTGFQDTPVGPVPQIATALKAADAWGTLGARIGFGRNQYKVAPGLYCVGHPTAASPVLVTANYKLTFDSLRRELEGLDLWLLVVDTRGINVWCAAGKGTFSGTEVARRIEQTQLAKVVQHRELILPQLAATGVSAQQVRKDSGFKVIWGPIQAQALPEFIQAGNKARPEMRLVTFTLKERLVLIPVELYFIPKYALWVLLAAFILSGIGDGIFSFSDAWNRGLLTAIGCLTGIVAGAVAAPALLPWIPGKAFAIKGSLTGLLFSAGILIWLQQQLAGIEALALVMITTALSSYLAMNFTGSTPFTSPSGVEKEMRQAIPLQAGSVVVAAILWVSAGFMG